MTRSRSSTILASVAVTALVALAVVVAGSGPSVSTPPAKAASGQPPTVGVAQQRRTVSVRSTRLGRILVNSQGRTLYLFTKDSGTKSACSGACAKAWPPLRASGKATVGGGARASMVRTTKRSDGKTQVTYNRHPLYLFSKDHKAGDTNGEGLTAFGGRWFAVSGAGKQVSHAPAKSPAPKPAAPKTNPSPQNGGGDGDSDNFGGPSDGDGNI
jgi:predicted lipoprotein with Yx(FWY)xxD motif